MMTGQDRSWEQLERMLPLIEIERQAFIRREHDRLQVLMGTLYWDEEAASDRLFHPEAEPEVDGELIHRPTGDPYRITLEELCRMPAMKRRITRLGTESYITFFHMHKADRERIRFLADIWGKLTGGQACTEAEEKKLEEGHESYCRSCMQDPVVVVK